MSYDCFISYQSADLRLAEQVHQGLIAAGLDPSRIWFDKKRLQPGFEWHKEIEAGCESSRVLLPVLTPRWQHSRWTRFETYGAEIVVPLRFEGDFEAVATPPLKRFQAQEINFTAGDPAAGWARLATAIQDLLQRPQPQKHERVALLRYHRNPHFVGREADLLAIHQHLHDRPTTDLTQGKVHVIAALGGMGKTTLAREYAEKFWRCYVAILWVDARNPGGIEAEFADLYTTLHPEAAADLKQAERASRLLQLLKGREERLLIIDNAEDEASIRRWLPNAGGCRTLITSRFSGWSTAISVTAIDTLEPAAARKLLRERSGMPADEPAEASACAELAEALGHLPLALEQAGAYMLEEYLGFSDYLKRFRDKASSLLREGVLGSTEYPDAVMTTWSATIARMPPPARALLRLASFMAPTPIPLQLCIEGANIVRDACAVLQEKEQIGTGKEGLPENDEDLIRRAVTQLSRYSLVRRDATTFRVHGLVQTVERLNLPVNRFVEWALGAQSYLDACPEDPSDPAHWALLRETALHLDHIAHNGWVAAEKSLGQPEAERFSPAYIFTRTLNMLTYLGRYHAAIGNHAAAERYLRLAVEQDPRLPADPRRTARAVISLSDLLLVLDRIEEAIQLRKREVELYEAGTEPGDPAVARPLRRLADALVVAGRFADAEAILHKALAVARQRNDALALELQGDCLVSLLALCNETGREPEAEALRDQYVELQQRLLPSAGTPFDVGAAHLMAARAAQRAGDADRFAIEIRKYLEANETSPLVTRDTLAHALGMAAIQYRGAGLPADAEALLRRALQIAREVHGDLKLETADALSELAEACEDQEKWAAALDARREALRIREQLFPLGHSSTGEASLALARLLMRSGSNEDPELLLRRAVVLLEQARGPGHPSVRDCCVHLAHVLLGKNGTEEANQLMTRSLAISEQQYGAGSDEVGEILRSWERALREAGLLEVAAPFATRSLALHENLYGKLAIELLPDIHSQIAHARHREDAQAIEHYLVRGLMIIQSVKPVDERRMAEWRMMLGLHYSQNGRPAEGEEFLRQGTLHSLATSEVDELVVMSAFALLEILIAADRPTEVEKLALQVLGATLGHLDKPGPAPQELLQAAVKSTTETWIVCRLRSGMGGEEIQATLVEMFQEHSQLPLLGSILETIHSRAGS